MQAELVGGVMTGLLPTQVSLVQDFVASHASFVVGWSSNPVPGDGRAKSVRMNAWNHPSLSGWPVFVRIPEANAGTPRVKTSPGRSAPPASGSKGRLRVPGDDMAPRPSERQRARLVDLSVMLAEVRGVGS